MTYSCDTFHADLDDRLDDLLEPTARQAFDAHLRACDACHHAHAQAATVRDALYRPYAVDPLPVGLRARIEAAAQGRRPSRAALVLRYAASFAAGVLVTLALTTGEAQGTAPADNTASAKPSAAEHENTDPAPAPEATAPSTPLRRIR